MDLKTKEAGMEEGAVLAGKARHAVQTTPHLYTTTAAHDMSIPHHYTANTTSLNYRTIALQGYSKIHWLLESTELQTGNLL